MKTSAALKMLSMIAGAASDWLTEREHALDLEAHHFAGAAVLSIAQGAPGWRNPLGPYESPMTDAVRKLRLEVEELRARAPAPHVVDGQVREAQ
jgi:hypothetical protein